MSNYLTILELDGNKQYLSLAEHADITGPPILVLSCSLSVLVLLIGTLKWELRPGSALTHCMALGIT